MPHQIVQLLHQPRPLPVHNPVEISLSLNRISHVAPDGPGGRLPLVIEVAPPLGISKIDDRRLHPLNQLTVDIIKCKL